MPLIYFVFLLTLSSFRNDARTSEWYLYIQDLNLSIIVPTHVIITTDVMMSAKASQITDVLIVCPVVCSGADQRKHQSFTSLAFVQSVF